MTDMPARRAKMGAIARTTPAQYSPSGKPSALARKAAKGTLDRKLWWLARSQALHRAASTEPELAVEVRVSVRSESNERQHWAQRAERAAMQRRITTAALSEWPTRQTVLRVRQALAHGATAIVGLTVRRGRAFDDDNRTGSTKALRDALAKTLEVDDGSRRYVFLPVAFERSERETVLVEVWIDASGIAARAGANPNHARQLVGNTASATDIDAADTLP